MYLMMADLKHDGCWTDSQLETQIRIQRSGIFISLPFEKALHRNLLKTQKQSNHFKLISWKQSDPIAQITIFPNMMCEMYK